MAMEIVLNGIVTAFFLAVLTDRVFLIDSESPLLLELLLAPHVLDWRVRSGTFALAELRHHYYIDKRKKFEDDLDRIAAYPDSVLIMTNNYRMLRSLWEAKSLRSQAEKLGFPLTAPKFLVAEAFDLLFSPTSVILGALAKLRESLGLPQEGRFIAIHFRTGNIVWDPARHSEAELGDFLDCARTAEEEQRLPATTPWLLATDSANIAKAAMETPVGRSGKLRIPSSEGRVHIDRSELGDALSGSVANYAEWLLFAQASAMVISRSYFGETAAEVGRAEAVYFAPVGCIRVDLSSS